MGGYTGGAFNSWIPDDYTYADYEADMDKALPFILAVSASDEGEKYGEEIALLLAMDNEITSAFGRLTAYAERNGIGELY